MNMILFQEIRKYLACDLKDIMTLVLSVMYMTMRGTTQWT